MRLDFGPRRATYRVATQQLQRNTEPLSAAELTEFESFDRVYRSLCALLFNYVPTSGHPGGSISSGRIVTGILFDAMDYDAGDPNRDDADIVSYAAGHKALGLYALWALRNEVLRIGAPDLLPEDVRLQLRLEDLLGFRRNPVTRTPRFLEFGSKPLDGHPTPSTPFVRLATGASGVGVAASLGLALGARDYYGADAPRVHIVEGEGGLTPGRVSEALAAAGTSRLDNAVLHVDWNQSSIDSDRVCRDESHPGDYVQWDPRELAYLHDWNVVDVPDGKDFQQVFAAQRLAAASDNGQPTAIVYRTVKGWGYGIEGRASHGAGHKMCSDEFYGALLPLLEAYGESVPSCCDLAEKRCASADGSSVMEECLWESLLVVRRVMEREEAMISVFADRLRRARQRLDERRREPRDNAATVETVYSIAQERGETVPDELTLVPGSSTTLRAELGRAMHLLNRESGGALLVASADLLGSTSVDLVGQGFPGGYYDAQTNPDSRRLSVGGICEDAMSGLLGGLSTFGRHIGVGSSYGAFLAALGHIAARLHAIGSEATRHLTGQPYRPMILVCAHAGLKTGEDGPTHADPQPLQLVQQNFPPGTAVTLTPWDPQELWPLLAASLKQRPAVILPFVTRPNERVLDRAKNGWAPAAAASSGVYRLRAARGCRDGSVVLQGSGVTYAFLEQALPLLKADGIELDVFYVSSAELFDALPPEQQQRLFPDEQAQEAMGITGFTLPTMYRWIRSSLGREATLHPFRHGHFLGSGQADRVLEQAGLDGRSQYEAVAKFVRNTVRA